MRLSLPSLLFTAAIVTVPLVQAGWELACGERVQALDVFGPVTEARLRAFDEELRDGSFLARVGARWYQGLLAQWADRGNEKAVFGRGGWLYYGDDLDFVCRPDAFERHGAAAVRGVTAFAGQLADRGIHLVVAPMLPKGVVDPEHLSTWTADLDWAPNPGFPRFVRALEEHGVDVFDASELLRPRAETPGAPPQYLPRDTHFSPATMARLAGALAERVCGALGREPEPRVRWSSETAVVEAEGDIVRMLQLPSFFRLFPPMRLELERVVEAASGAPWRPDPSAEVLLLGDSFSLAFSDADLALGSGAGLAEHLALALGTRVDRIALPGGSARAARESLSRSPGRLDGVRLVLWQISARDLLDEPAKWDRVPLPEPAGAPDARAVEGRVEPLRVVAEVAEVSRVPPRFRYDFCLAVFEYRVLEGPAELLGEPLWVAHVAMRDFADTEAAHLAAGERLELELEPVERHHDLDETSWVDDTGAGDVLWFPTSWSRRE